MRSNSKRNSTSVQPLSLSKSTRGSRSRRKFGLLRVSTSLKTPALRAHRIGNRHLWMKYQYICKIRLEGLCFSPTAKRKLRVRERPWFMYLVSIFEGNEETRCLVDDVLTENVYADKCVQACLLNRKSAQMNSVEEKNKHELARCIIKHPDGDCISPNTFIRYGKEGKGQWVDSPSLDRSLANQRPSSFLWLST